MNRFFLSLSLLILLGSPTLGAGARPARIRHTIVVNKADNTLRFYATGQKVQLFRVATGLYKCTPEGRFHIVEKSVVSRRGTSPFGTRWMGLNTLGKRGLYHIGIHGTNDPRSIGHYSSKACVRMRNRDVNWLYDRAPVGTTVRIINHKLVPAPAPPKLPPAWLLTFLKPKPQPLKPALVSFFPFDFTSSLFQKPQPQRAPMNWLFLLQIPA